MPTYVCTARSGSSSDQQKEAIAKAISHAHSEATGAPSYFVQVVFDEKGAADRFLGGQPADRHIWIRGDIRAGRTAEQRGRLMLQIMRDVSAIAGVPETGIWVYLCNLVPTDMVEYGHVLPAPGEEEAWFETLPQALQAFLIGLGTGKEDFSL
ncbi:tautomerase family protein [Beijerinckia sp. L45]|uniref:tautomerase family protein n=1 Tax=Beijerinckia sp. L45 TaxID=1641855 RepID=UPI00131AAE75|nr:tautomerase family protein [Beijerinckia sp. L45]